MGSLRGFHVFFLLVAIAAADFFGVWSIWDYQQRQDTTVLTLGIVALICGLGLIAYTVWFIRKMNRAHIE